MALNKRLSYYAALPFSKLLPFKLLRSLSGKSLITPYYHTVSDRYLPHISPLYPVISAEQLRKDLALMARHYTFISAVQMAEFAKEGFPEDQHLAFLSFDDGLLACAHEIRDILKSMGIPATFFINPGFVDTDDVFFRYKVALILDRLRSGKLLLTEKNEMTVVLSEMGLLKGNLDMTLRSLRFIHRDLIDEMLESLSMQISNRDIYMNSDEIKSLVNDGFDIGGHSMDHPHFSDLTLNEQLKEIGESVDFCQQKFHAPLRLFAFPFYDYDLGKELFEQMEKELELDLSFGTSGLKTEAFPFHFQRLVMERKQGASLDYLKKQLAMTYLRTLVGRDLMQRHE